MNTDFHGSPVADRQRELLFWLPPRRTKKFVAHFFDFYLVCWITNYSHIIFL
jgi:hypothetical protein